ncbi:MAG: FAD-dependent oxidoreductase [Lentisphaeria bacterium]
MRTSKHQVEFCVIGGGLAGLCAAVAAARRGVKTLLMHDRPVLGGNASSEVRMWVCGAHGDHNRETGLIEEILLDNLRRNPAANFSLWDSILYEKARFQDNLTLLLNTTCLDAVMDGHRIRSVKGWQLTAETWHEVAADCFADCSGDSILAPLTGAEFRLGREARGEFNEDIEPEVADAKTMGMSCLLQARETNRPCGFTPPAWAHRYPSCGALPHRGHRLEGCQNFWWLEIGGEGDILHDAETNRDELLKIAFGVWDHIKNHCRDKDEFRNWDLEWVGFLPGKRESRRYVGDHVMTQNDVRAGGAFPDVVAYGGWSMDDHHPAGFRHPGEPTVFHPAPSPFGIPYRCLYSRNITNLFVAGRNISVTHAAMSSCRVMATCALLGQAVGTAAAIASRQKISPRAVGQQHLDELQQALLDDDCRLPGITRRRPPPTLAATLSASVGDPEPLRRGDDRTAAWNCRCNDTAEYRFAAPTPIRSVRLVFDSHLNRREMNIRALLPLDRQNLRTPQTLVREFRLEILAPDGTWRTVGEVRDQAQRLVRLKLDVTTTALRLTPLATWGSDTVRVFAWDIT